MALVVRQTPAGMEEALVDVQRSGSRDRQLTSTELRLAATLVWASATLPAWQLSLGGVREEVGESRYLGELQAHKVLKAFKLQALRFATVSVSVVLPAMQAVERVDVVDEEDVEDVLLGGCQEPSAGIDDGGAVDRGARGCGSRGGRGGQEARRAASTAISEADDIDGSEFGAPISPRPGSETGVPTTPSRTPPHHVARWLCQQVGGILA